MLKHLFFPAKGCRQFLLAQRVSTCSTLLLIEKQTNASFIFKEICFTGGVVKVGLDKILTASRSRLPTLEKIRSKKRKKDAKENKRKIS
jgi:hypothetical protein